MPEAPLTPEEKLLRIIEAPPGAAPPKAPGRRLQDFKFSFSFKSLKAQYGGKFNEKVRELLNLKTLNVSLAVLAAAATVFLILDFPLGMPRSSALAHIEASSRKLEIGELTLEGLEPLSIYMQEITQRNIFSLPEPPSPKPAVPKQPAPTPEIVQMTNSLKLVGIMWSDVPQAIIEDARDGRTYLLNRGGTLKGARVKDILKDKVILSYDNQDIELR